MANPMIDQLKAAVTKNTEVNQSAVILVNGIAARIKTAVDAALANGATAAELAPLTAEIATLTNSATALGEAVAANT